jgi:DivIVA domain-containing protein
VHLLLRDIRRSERPGRTSRSCYRSAAYAPLQPWQVRDRRFRLTGLGERGLDPTEVHEFLGWVPGDLAAAYETLARSRQKTARVKDALRRWQSQQAQAANERGHR